MNIYIKNCVQSSVQWQYDSLACINWQDFNSQKKHIDNLVRKTGYKLYTVRCIRKFPTVEKPKILGNAFIDKRLN